MAYFRNLKISLSYLVSFDNFIEIFFVKVIFIIIIVDEFITIIIVESSVSLLEQETLLGDNHFEFLQ